MSEADIATLLQNDAIIRNRAKIAAVIGNARRVPALIADMGSLAAYVWGFEPAATAPAMSRTTSPESVAMARDLKKRGWAFVGPTTVFALMQSMGLINDHVEGCVTRQAVAQARAGFQPPV
jgi:DNA-3-methyladenine glycosylase I